MISTLSGQIWIQADTLRIFRKRIHKCQGNMQTYSLSGPHIRTEIIFLIFQPKHVVGNQNTGLSRWIRK